MVGVVVVKGKGVGEVVKNGLLSTLFLEVSLLLHFLIRSLLKCPKEIKGYKIDLTRRNRN